MDYLVKKASSFLTLSLFVLALLIGLTTQARASKVEDIDLSLEGQGGKVDLSLDFNGLYRLNPQEKFEALVLDHEESVKLNGIEVGKEKADISLESSDGELNFSLESDLEEDFIIRLENPTMRILLIVNAMYGHGQVFEFATDLEPGVLDYEEGPGMTRQTRTFRMAPRSADLTATEEAMATVLKGDFDFSKKEDVTLENIKKQIGEKLPQGFEFALAYNKETKAYSLSVWESANEASKITKPLYINSDVSITFDNEDILKYSTIKKTNSASVGLVDGKLSVSDTEGQAYSNIVLPVFNYGRDFVYEADIVHNGGVNANRWVAISFGLEPVAGQDYPTFWQMAIRKNAAASNGIELANRNDQDKWDVPYTASFKEELKNDQTYRLTVVVDGDEVREYIDGELVLKGVATQAMKSGKFALTYDRANATFDNIRISGTIPENLPKDFPKEENEYVGDIYQPETKIGVPPTVVLNRTDDIAGLVSQEKRPATVSFDINEDLQVSQGTDKLTLDQTFAKLDERAMAAFNVKDMATATKLKDYLVDNNIKDVFIISNQAKVLDVFKTGETNKIGLVGIRTVLDMSESKFGEEDLIQYVYEANKSSSRIVIIPENLVNRDNVFYIQSRAVSVWVKTSDDLRSNYDNILAGVYGIITEDSDRTIQAIESFDEDYSDKVILRNPVVVAHRAFHWALPYDLAQYGMLKGEQMPENSVSAAKAAVGIHADAIESDIYLSKDGKIVVNHDSTTKRLSLKDVVVEESTLAELKEVYYQERPNESIPTLEEFLLASKDSGAVQVIEIKSGNPKIVPALREVLERMDMMDQAMVISFNRSQMEMVRELMPELSVGYLNEYVSSAASVNGALKQLSESLDPINAFYNMSKGSQTYDQLKFAAHRGILFHPWTVNALNEFQSQYERGYHGITSNAPDQAVSFLNDVKLEKREFTPAEFEKLVDFVKAYYRDGQVESVQDLKIKKLDENSKTKSTTLSGQADNTDLYTVGVNYDLEGTGNTYTVYSPSFLVKEAEANEPNEPNKPDDKPSKPSKNPVNNSEKDPPTVNKDETEDKTIEIKRTSGQDRIATAIKLSKENFTNAEALVVVRSDVYPDSLTASVLAKAIGGPILLTQANSLDPRVADEIERLGADKVYIVGAESSISPSTADSLDDMVQELVRIGGSDRYETSALVARELEKILGKREYGIIASGQGYPDALSISSFAADKAYPILLVKKDELPKPIEQAMKDLEIEKTYIAGGFNTISQDVQAKLTNVEKRFAGKDRYETSKIIAESLYGQSKNAYLASGEVFADALVIGPIAGKDKAPVLLTKKKELPKVVLDYINKSEIEKINLVGGTSTVEENSLVGIK